MIIFYSKAGFAYDWISLIADVGGWTGTLIGIRYALYVGKIFSKHISYCRADGVL
jgi:hypothetical protein